MPLGKVHFAALFRTHPPVQKSDRAAQRDRAADGEFRLEPTNYGHSGAALEGGPFCYRNFPSVRTGKLGPFGRCAAACGVADLRLE
jgi:hypothetical protein